MHQRKSKKESNIRGLYQLTELAIIFFLEMSKQKYFTGEEIFNYNLISHFVTDVRT